MSVGVGILSPGAPRIELGFTRCLGLLKREKKEHKERLGGHVTDSGTRQWWITSGGNKRHGRSWTDPGHVLKAKQQDFLINWMCEKKELRWISRFRVAHNWDGEDGRWTRNGRRGENQKFTWRHVEMSLRDLKGNSIGRGMHKTGVQKRFGLGLCAWQSAWLFGWY